jgi:8-oxo-dGTP pyrophosphatase MutT (NUDIX family)
MTKNEFLKNFQLSPLSKSAQQEKLLTQSGKLVESAVLIALCEINGQLTVLLTKRASHLKHHPGQVSFPGGKVESTDSSIIATALREAQEEIGLPHENIQVIGQLHPYQTITGFKITPIIAFIDHLQHYQLDKNEVEEIFHVPLNHFLNSKKHVAINVQHITGNQQVHFMPYKHHNIWGATAAILKDLVAHLYN